MLKKLIVFSVVALLAAPALAQVEYHGSARVIIPPNPAGEERANEVYLFDSSGNLTGSYPQFGDARTDDWGYRDGATDGQNRVYFGWGGGINRHDADGSNPEQIVFDGGPNGTWRALAFDPTGDGGVGSLWSGDFGDDIVEIDLSGNVLNTLPNGGQYSLYGLAYDDSDGNLWGHHRNPTPANAEIVKIDSSTGLLIPGAGFPDGFTMSGSTAATNGGLSGYSELGGNIAALCQCTPSDSAGVYDLAAADGSFAAGPWDWQSQILKTGADAQNLGIAVVVPEPSAFALIGMALAGLGFIRRR